MFDIVVSMVALVVLCVPLVLVALAIRLDSPGPALFRQIRIGRGGRPFPMWKFRSMVHGAAGMRAGLSSANEADGPLFKIASDPRITRVGRFLRAMSVDELPQLVNVLRGEMSLVGPRPALPEEVATYDARARARLAITPGITGPWQVSGRHTSGFEQYLACDLGYIAHRSFLGDLALLARTVPAIVRRSGA